MKRKKNKGYKKKLRVYILWAFLLYYSFTALCRFCISAAFAALEISNATGTTE